jgi:hypothetical protein
LVFTLATLASFASFATFAFATFTASLFCIRAVPLFVSSFPAAVAGFKRTIDLSVASFPAAVARVRVVELVTLLSR